MNPILIPLAIALASLSVALVLCWMGEACAEPFAMELGESVDTVTPELKAIKGHVLGLAGQLRRIEDAVVGPARKQKAGNPPVPTNPKPIEQVYIREPKAARKRR